MRQIQANLRDTSNTAKISWNDQNIISYGGWHEVDQVKKKKIQNQSDLKGESVHRHYAILSRRST